jgi:hypothetical protein
VVLPPGNEMPAGELSGRTRLWPAQAQTASGLAPQISPITVAASAGWVNGHQNATAPRRRSHRLAERRTIRGAGGSTFD